jgi:hypothetical protein
MNCRTKLPTKASVEGNLEGEFSLFFLQNHVSCVSPMNSAFTGGPWRGRHLPEEQTKRKDYVGFARFRAMNSATTQSNSVSMSIELYSSITYFKIRSNAVISF